MQFVIFSLNVEMLYKRIPKIETSGKIKFRIFYYDKKNVTKRQRHCFKRLQDVSGSCKISKNSVYHHKQRRKENSK